MWFDDVDEPVSIDEIVKDLRGRGIVVLDVKGKSGDYGFDRRHNRFHVYGVALYESDRDIRRVPSTKLGRDIIDRIERGEYYTPRPQTTGQRVISDYDEKERFELIDKDKRRYRDTITGEDISYREFGKRSGRAWALKQQSPAKLKEDFDYEEY